LSPTPYSLFYLFIFIFYFCLVYLLSVYGFVFNLAPSRGLLDFFPLGGSLQAQEVKVFSSNPFEDLEFVGFALRLGCSKLWANIDFLFLTRLRLVRGVWMMHMGFLFLICTFCAVSEVVGNVWGEKNDDELHNLRYFFSRTLATFWSIWILMFGWTIGLLIFKHKNRLIIEQVLVEFYSSTWINLFHSIFIFFFHLEETLYRFIGDSLRCMPANVIEFMFLASLDCVLLFNLYILPW
jgi:hypothetical protein